MTGFKLRTAVPDDEAAVTRLLQVSYGELMPLTYGKAVAAAFLPRITRAQPELLASGTYYLAVTPEGEVIGAGGWTRTRPGSRGIEDGVGHVRHVATHPAWTGKGVGRAIMERCFGEAKSVGIACFECNASLNAVDFYAGLGFKELRPIDIPVDGDLVMPSLLMERTL